MGKMLFGCVPKKVFSHNATFLFTVHLPKKQNV